MDVNVYVNGPLRADLRVLSLLRSYVRPWECVLAYDGRHDYEGGRTLDLYDWIEVRDAATGAFLFRGNVTQADPGGVDREGMTWTCQGRRFRLQNEVVRINGSAFYTWNRRGFRCSKGSGEDSPGRDGGKWTAGEICVDILEHALGVPAVGSAIAGHHADDCCVTNTYLTGLDIVGYDAAAWLAVNSVIGEFSVSSTPVASALDMLLAMAGGFYGWYIDECGVLRIHDLKGLAQTNVRAGELGHWQDEAGKDYALLDNNVEWDLDGVYSSVTVQGTDRTVEVKPVNIEGSGSAALGGGGELEMVAEPWRGYPSCYRALCQPYRRWTAKNVGAQYGSCADWPGGGGPECGVPDGLFSVWPGPRIYRGTDAGAKTYLTRLAGGPTWRISLATGMVMFYWVPPLGVGEKLWGWYWAQRPFTRTAGPEGTAYECFGYERTLYVYDPAFRSTTSYPAEGDAVEGAEMETLAGRLLEQVRDVRLQGRLRCDEVDPTALHLRRRYNVLNLTAPTGGACDPDPMDWANVALNAVSVLYDFVQNATEITVANSFWMLEEYSEMKRRLFLNREITTGRGLAEDTLECQIQQDDHEDDADYSTSSPAPVTTTTEGPTTTPAPGPTTSTTTAAPEPPYCDCDVINDKCYRLRFAGLCDGYYYPKVDAYKCLADVVWSKSEVDADGKKCIWSGGMICGHPDAPWPWGGATTTKAPPTSTTTDGGFEPPTRAVELIFHPVAGWMVIHGANSWIKVTDKMDCENPEGAYSCVCGGDGSVLVSETPCPSGPPAETTTTTTRAPTTTTAAPTTTTTAGPPPTTTTTAAAPCCDNCISSDMDSPTYSVACNLCGAPPCDATVGCEYEQLAGVFKIGASGGLDACEGDDCSHTGGIWRHIYSLLSENCP